VSLLVAAYWAGDAFRAMLAAFKATAYDGPRARGGAGEEVQDNEPIEVA
jgi:hypothetical protein